MGKAFKTLGALLVWFVLLGFFVTPAISAGIPLWTDDFEGEALPVSYELSAIR